MLTWQWGHRSAEPLFLGSGRHLWVPWVEMPLLQKGCGIWCSLQGWRAADKNQSEKCWGTLKVCEHQRGSQIEKLWLLGCRSAPAKKWWGHVLHALLTSYLLISIVLQKLGTLFHPFPSISIHVRVCRRHSVRLQAILSFSISFAHKTWSRGSNSFQTPVGLDPKLGKEPLQFLKHKRGFERGELLYPGKMADLWDVVILITTWGSWGCGWGDFWVVNLLSRTIP